MINTEKLQDIIELVLWSGWLKNASPVSMLVVAHVGAGKTTMLNMFRRNKGIAYLNDTTAYGICRYLLPELQAGNINHIIIPDLVTPLSKNRTTVNSFIAFLNGLLEEGIVDIQTYAIQFRCDGIKCGLISAITRDDLFDSRHGWTKMGFMSRIVPVTWTYSKETVITILNKIAEGISEEGEKFLGFPEEKQEVEEDITLNKLVIPFSLALQEAERVYGFRRQKQLQTLMMASALRRGSKCVEVCDLEKISDIVAYMDLQHPPQL